jgi:putative phosphoesterase
MTNVKPEEYGEGGYMRLGLIADIHGNGIALDTVLADLAREGVDQIVCLGDVAAHGPDPAEVTARLREMDILNIMGNTDAWLLDPSLPVREHRASDPMAAITDWNRDHLSAGDLAYLAASPLRSRLSVEGASILLYHGSPRSYDDVISSLTSEQELDVMLAGHRAPLMVGGHTHVQMLRRFGEISILNTGSVGLPGTGPGTPDLPVNTDAAWAEYAILTLTSTTRHIDFRRTPLDVAEMLAHAESTGMPHLDWWAARWAAQPLS